MCELMENFVAKRMAEERLNTLVELAREGMIDVQKAALKAGMTPEAFQNLVASIA